MKRASRSLPKALEVCLRPLVRLCIAFGVSYWQLTESLRHLYISVAENECKLPGQAQTDSRVSMLTGIYRRDVKRLRQTAFDSSAMKPTNTLASNVISCWLGTPELITDTKEPRPIPRLPSKGHCTSFEQIVASITTDIRPKVLLDDWLRSGVITLDNDDHVHLNVSAFLPASDIEQKITFFAHSMHDHMAAAAWNLQGLKPAQLDRFIWCNGLTPDDAALLETVAEKAAMRALKTVNEKALELKQLTTDTPRELKSLRITFGSFFYREELPPEDERSKGE